MSVPRDDVAIHQYISNVFGVEFRCGESERVCKAAGTIRAEENGRRFPGRCRRRPKVVDTDTDSRAVGQGDRADWPDNC